MKVITQEIADDIFMITLPMPFRLKHVNIYAIVKDGRVSLIDTGPNFPGVFSALEKSLGKIGCEVTGIDQIFITHSHVDHCGLAGTIQGISGAAVYMREMEYRRAMADLEMFIMSKQSFYRQEGLPYKVFCKIVKTYKMFKNTIIPFREKDFLVPGENKRFQNEMLEVINTPGHTAGQVVFFLRERGLLFSGDHVLPYITPNLGPDPADLAFRPLRSFIDSLNKVRDLPVSMVCPAHGAPFADLKGRVEEIRAHHDERKSLIMNALNTKPKTAYAISRDVFGVDLPDFDQFLAFNETLVHLTELESELVIRRESTGWAIGF